jgi:hypothetical protein
VKLFLPIFVSLGVSLAAAAAHAGGGPQNVFLLVNANSDTSKTIANYYIKWRDIPASNVMYVNWKGSLGTVAGNEFRDGILIPTINAMDERHVGLQIDYIVYSSDFPWRVDLRPLFPNRPFPRGAEPDASINGATYLLPFLLHEIPSPGIVEPDTNWYVPGPNLPNILKCQSLADVRSRGFRSQYPWDPNGMKLNNPAMKHRSYLLSTVLGITRNPPRGNTLEEILHYLHEAASSDGTFADQTRPRGTIYFMWNKDIRSSTRDKCFAAVAAQINAAGGRAVVQQGRTPVGAKDVAGLTMGTSDFNLAKEGIQILPGAICDNLTSEGGIMAADAGQTTLSEFLRHGAAGASGTVVEPLSLQEKFPLASIQLHYVRGCSLAESFYQSVSGPYQLLIVGDALCQPWAVRPKIAVNGVKPDEKVKGKLSITPLGPPSIGIYELFIDGRLAVRATPGAAIPIDTTTLADGYHELRVVGIRSNPIETQGRVIVPVLVTNHDATLELKVSPAPHISFDAKLKVSVRQPGATSITVRQNTRDVARVQGESGSVEIAAATLGRGPVTLQAFSEGSVAAASVPVSIDVQ